MPRGYSARLRLLSKGPGKLHTYCMYAETLYQVSFTAVYRVSHERLSKLYEMIKYTTLEKKKK